MPEKELISRLRSDIRDEIKQQSGKSSDGGHFYTPFWSDVKLHVLGKADLSDLTQSRIKADKKKKDLYPELEKGFLKLWARGSNQRVKLIDKSPRGKLEFDDYNLTIKIENIMAITINDNERLGYPYWFPNPSLSDEAGRIALWAIGAALPDQNKMNVRVFDIMRSEFYSLENTPLHGNEKELLLTNFERVHKKREELKREY